ncbi:MAG: hypothetical protein UE295_00790 [Acutalibacteraceae bacterium]|nr:hypothetical protein [Acutalibacteraceae bacterium]
MSKRLTWFIWLFFSFFMIIALIISLYSFKKENTEENTAPTEIYQSTDYQTYIVREYNGMIAVFYSGQDKPFKITDSYVESLPQQDIDNLKHGIIVDNEENLRKLLEDLCS